MATDSQSVEIPVWFNGTQRWMTGVTKRTTCDDVIYALLVSTGMHETESTDTFAIFEKWREVERPLSARTKLLKVWSFWGEEQPNVQLSMRSLDDYFLPGESSLYTRSRRRHKKSSRHKDRHSTQCRHHNKPEYTECSRFRTLEQLVKMVVSQERKIQDLSDRIQETDTLIDKHEARIHFHRVQQNGMDYVQNSYLNNHSSESSSNSSADNTSFTNLDLRELKAIFPDSSFQQLEEIARVCENMGHIEQRVAQEQAKIKELTKEAEMLAESTGAVVPLEGEVNSELEEARVQMIRAVATYVTNEYNERELDRKIDICLAEIAAKTEYINEMQRDIYETQQRVSDTELSERRVIEENNSKSQRSTSAEKPPVIGAHSYNLLNTQQDTRYETSLNPSRAAEDHKHIPNRNRNLYNISGQFLRSLQLDKKMTADTSETSPKNSSFENGLLQDKLSAVNPSFLNRAKYSIDAPNATANTSKYNGDITVANLNTKYSDDAPAAPFNREGRSIRRSNRALQRPLFVRSRSAERSTDASKLSMNSQYGRVSGCENDILNGKSESHLTKAIADQYGLEMSTQNTYLRGSSRDSYRSKNNNVSKTPSNFIPRDAYNQQNEHKESKHVTNSDVEYRYQHAEMGRKMHENTISIPINSSNNDSHGRRIDRNSNGESGFQVVSHDHARDLRTSLNTQYIEDKTDSQSAGVHTFDGQDNRILGGQDLFFKERPLFEQNISALPRNGSDSCSNGVYRGAAHTDVRNSPSNRTFDLAKPERKNSPECRNGYHSRLQGNNIYLSSVGENMQIQYETEGTKHLTQFSSSKSGTNDNSPTERQAMIQKVTGEIYKQRVQENNPSSVNPCLKFQTSNQHITHSGNSPRQQRTSQVPETYSPRLVSEDSLHTNFKCTDTEWYDRSGMRHQHEPVNNTNINSSQPLPDTTYGQHKKLHFNTDATIVNPNGVTRENIPSSHSLNGAVKSPVTPKMEPSLLSNKETDETNISGHGGTPNF